MIPKHQIRADYDRDTIVVYQAYRPAIAEAALGAAVLTAPRPGQGADQWRHQLEQSPVRVQWDPERSLRGAKLDYRSIQVGISRHLSRQYAEQWTVAIEDRTPLVHKLRRLRLEGKWSAAARLLPQERPYPVDEQVARRLEMF